MSLVEGVDFDEMGPEVYRDALIRVVASGGIPIYTAIGYTGNIGYGITAADICGPGKGLKSFDRLFEEEVAKPGAAFNVNSLHSENRAHINTLPEANRNITKKKFAMAGIRTQRLRNDPTYSSRIFFRAPIAWPHSEKEDGTIQLLDTLKGCDLVDYHMQSKYKLLMAGAEDGEYSRVGVILHVDPNHTYVFNSNARINNVSKEIIYGAQMTLSEYLLKMKSAGVGTVDNQMEIYVTPADGFLSSENFQGCITYDDTESIVKINGALVSDRTPSERYLTFRRDAIKRFDTLNIERISIVRWFNEAIGYIMSISKVETPVTIPKSTDTNKKTILPQILQVISHVYKSVEPRLVIIKKKIYPYMYKLWQVLTPDVIHEMRQTLVSKYIKMEEYAGIIPLTYQTYQQYINEVSEGPFMDITLMKAYMKQKRLTQMTAPVFVQYLQENKIQSSSLIKDMMQLAKGNDELFAFIDGLPEVTPFQASVIGVMQRSSSEKRRVATRKRSTSEKRRVATRKRSSSEKKPAGGGGGGGNMNHLRQKLATLEAGRQSRTVLAQIAAIKKQLGE